METSLINETKNEIVSYLQKNNWSSEYDHKTDVRHFYKKRAPTTKAGHSFLEYSKRSIPLHPIEINNILKKNFDSYGFINDNLKTIIGSHPKDPLFVCAAIQYFSNFFHGDINAENKDYFISQPVIRTQLRERVGQGSTSSFVNVGTANCNSTPQQHVETLDYWLDSLSNTGLYVPDLNLELKPKKIGENFWSSFNGVTLKLEYGGLEIGTASALTMPNRDNELISDIGMGLERLTWAINKSSNYFDVIGPKPYSFSSLGKTIDAIRTATLIASSGLLLSDKDRHRQLNAYIKNIPEDENGLNDLIKNYHNYWSKFIPLKKTSAQTSEIVQSLVNKKRNKNLLERLNTDIPEKERMTFMGNSQNDFIEYLITSRRIDLDKIKEALTL